jgi:hypothetical protein
MVVGLRGEHIARIAADPNGEERNGAKTLGGLSSLNAKLVLAGRLGRSVAD